MTRRPNSIRIMLVVLGIAGAASGPVRAEEAEAPPMTTLNPQALTFTPIPDMPACATAAIVRGNPRTGPAWVYLKLASGCRVPTHWHTANEDLVVISGQGMITMTDGPSLPFVPGAFASLPSRHTHQASCTRTCLLFSMADAAFDINYVDANGEEISLERAMQLQSRRTKSLKKTKKK